MNGEARLPAGSGPRAAEEEKKMQPSLEHAARLLLSGKVMATVHPTSRVSNLLSPSVN